MLRERLKNELKPVYKRNFPDASIVFDPLTNLWYAFATQNDPKSTLLYKEKRIHIQVSTSRDLKNWSKPKEGLGNIPTSAVEGNTWAPSVPVWNEILQKWVMFVSMEVADVNGNHMGIYVGTADRLDQAFIFKNDYLVTDTGFRCIDPHILIDGKDVYLYWGSNSSPIMVRKLDETYLKFKEGSVAKEVHTFAKNEYSDEGLIESPFVFIDRDCPNEILREYPYVMRASIGNTWKKNGYFSIELRAQSPEGPFIPTHEILKNPKIKYSLVLFADGFKLKREKYTSFGQECIIISPNGKIYTAFLGLQYNEKAEKKKKRPSPVRPLFIEELVRNQHGILVPYTLHMRAMNENLNNEYCLV